MRESTKTTSGTRKIPMTADVEECFRKIIEKRNPPKAEPMVDGKSGFLYFDKNESICYSLHWEHYFQHIIQKCNNTYKVQMTVITPHICRYTFCSMCAGAGLSPKTLQMIMGHSSIEFTLNVYTHLEAGNIKEQFFNMAQSKQYNFYSLDRAPAVVSLNDDYDEEPEPDFDEEADDED